MTGNREMLKVRGDALSGPSEYILAHKVLGRVTKQWRGSKVINLRKGFFKFFTCVWIHTYPIGSLCLCSAIIVKKILSFILCSLQGLRLYRTLAQMFIGKKVRYLITKGDLSFSGDKLKESFSFFDTSPICNERLSYEIRAIIGEKTVGSVTLFRSAENKLLYPDWWLFGMSVRTAYRGAGIGENLLVLAINKAFELHKNRLNLLVFEKNGIARNLYEKMGFRKISIPALDEQLEKEVRRGHPRRIIMSRTLCKDKQ
ncbi:MAG: GNAT family N-acetyltransferase [Nitrospirota bacterium]